MISLVIPLYNEEKLVDELMNRCLGVLNKIGKDFEIILIKKLLQKYIAFSLQPL